MNATKSIILESVLEEIFSYLPALSMEGGDAFLPKFAYGDEKELNLFLKNREETELYPLIWLLYPYEETHTKTGMQVDNISFILAVDTNVSYEVKARLETTIGQLLMPLFFNIRHAFKNANIMNTNDEYTLVKHPNFSSTGDGTTSAGAFIWDALKFTTSFTIIDTCLKPIKF